MYKSGSSNFAVVVGREFGGKLRRGRTEWIEEKLDRRDKVWRGGKLFVLQQRVSEWVEEEEAKRGIETDKRVRERSRMCLIIWRHLLLLYNCCWISFADSTPLWMSAGSHIFPFCLFQHIKTPIWTFHTSAVLRNCYIFLSNFFFFFLQTLYVWLEFKNFCTMATFLSFIFFCTFFTLPSYVYCCVDNFFSSFFSSSSNFQFENFSHPRTLSEGIKLFFFFEVEEFKWGKIPRGKFHSSDDLSEAERKKRWRERLRPLLAGEKGKKKRSWNFPMNDEGEKFSLLPSWNLFTKF